jgi:hypothetical protein
MDNQHSVIGAYVVNGIDQAEQHSDRRLSYERRFCGRLRVEQAPGAGQASGAASSLRVM